MERVDARWGGVRRERLTIGGDQVVCRVAGEGPVLLLVHGMAGSSETWRFVMPALAERFTVIAPDLLGQGESDKPRGEYSLSAHVDTLQRVLDELGHDRATLVGQSLGGGVAMQFAHQLPARCERLVLVNAGGLGREVSAYLRLLTLPGAERLFPLLSPAWVRGVGERVFARLERMGVQPAPAAMEIWRSYLSLTDPASRHAFFRSLHDVIDLGGQAVSALSWVARTTHLPTLIVWGATDPFIPPSHGEVAHAAMRGSRLVVFEDVGHYPHCEAPDRFIAVVREFLDATGLPPG